MAKENVDDDYVVDNDDDNDESLQRALADLEMVMAAYPDETSILLSSSDNNNNGNNNQHTHNADAMKTTGFPLQFRLHLSSSCYFDLIMRAGYPTTCNIEITSFRCDGNAENKERMEAAATAIRNTARMCLQQQQNDGDGDDDDNEGGGAEGGLACCAAAMEAWNNHTNAAVTTAITTICTTPDTSHDHHLPMDDNDNEDDGNIITQHQQQQQHHQGHHRCDYESPKKSKDIHLFTWITGKPLVDRKSTFLAHACHVSCEADVKLALQQLLDSHSKYRRATHNMYAYRLLESLPPKQGQECNDRGVVDINNNITQSQQIATTSTVLKHDNDDDGEDGAGSRLAHLLEMRQETNILVLVSRWYGGIQLGPKRFVHINNVARNVLVQAAAAAAAAQTTMPAGMMKKDKKSSGSSCSLE